MIDDVKSGLKIFEGDLLEENIELVFYFFGFMKEVELFLLFLGEKSRYDLLELGRSGLQTDFIGSKWLVGIVNEVDHDILRYVLLFMIFFDLFARLHFQQSI